MAGYSLSTTSGSKKKEREREDSEEESEADLIIDCGDDEDLEARNPRSSAKPNTQISNPNLVRDRGRRNSLDEKYDAVERALEEMFADSPGTLDKLGPSTSSATSSDSLALSVPKKRGRKPISEKNRYSVQQKPVTKKKNTKKPEPRRHEVLVTPELQNGKKAIKKLKLQEPIRDPFIRIEGDSKYPIWEGIVNNFSDPLSRSQEVEKSKSQAAQKVLAAGYGFHSTSVRPKYQSNILSSKYDSCNEDTSWNCVFCKRSSHHQSLGDLFGPFFLDLGSSPEVSIIKHRNKVKSHEPKSSSSTPSSQKKRHLSQVNGDAGKSEIWFHGDCLSWMQGIKLVGHVVLGLEDAIEASASVTCFACQKKGCTLACHEQKCFLTSHFICAKNSGWYLDEQKLRAYCAQHSQS